MEPHQDFTRMKDVLPSLLFVNKSNLVFNPQQVPNGMHPDVWIANYVDFFCEQQGLMQGGNVCYTSALQTLYRLFGVFEGSKNYPTMADTYNFLLNSRYQTSTHGEREIRGRLIQRLHSLLSIMHRNMNCSQGLTAEGIRNRSVVFQLGAFKDVGYDLITSTFMFQEYFHRMENDLISPLNLIISIDEGSRIFSKINEYHAYKTPILQTLVERCRKYGMGLDVTVQQLSGVASYLLANANHLFFFYSKGGADKTAFGKAAQLTQQQFYYLGKIVHRKECVVSTTKFPKPLMLRTINIDKYFRGPHNVTQEDLKRITIFFKFKPPDSTRMKTILEEETKGKKSKDDSTKKRLVHVPPKRRKEILKQLTQILKNWETKFSPKNQLFQKLNLTTPDKIEVRNMTRQDGLFAEVQIRTSIKEASAGRPTIFLKMPNDATFEHDYWVRRMQLFLERKGLKAEPEQLGCDLVHKDDSGRLIGWEFERSGTKALRNLQRNIDNGFHEIRVICDTLVLHDKIERLVYENISKEARNKISIKTKTDFFSGNTNNQN